MAWPFFVGNPAREEISLERRQLLAPPSTHPPQKTFLVSRSRVTGPSLISPTSIIWRKRPVATLSPGP